MEIINGVLLSVDDDDIGGNGLFTVPDGVTEIGKWAFEFCKSLTSVVIPKGVTKIGVDAFYGCENLTSVVISEGVTEICASAFEECKNLASVVIPDSVTRIRHDVFYGCESLTKVKLPKSITEIGVGAFFGCVQLKSKPSNYKAFQIKNGELYCLNKPYKEGETNCVSGNLEMCKNGIHYCTNLFEIFNHYWLDKDIAIYEIEVGDKVLTEEGSSKCCTNSCVLKKRLYREEIIRILNGEAE